MRTRLLVLAIAIVATIAALVAGRVDSPAFAGGTTLPTTTLLPVQLTGDVTTQSTPFLAWIKDLAPDKYVEEEYLVSGNANIYRYTDDASKSPAVEVKTADEPYTTRILVRRPTSNHKFNGTVYVDVLNATAGWDGDAIFQATHEYMIREGAIYVGVTTKPNTVNFLKSLWGNAPNPTRNASRYATLSMPKFGQVWDMMSQVGALLKTPGAAGNPLAGFDVERLLMVGYSQSAAYEVTYANSIHAAMPDGSPVYDGYYIAAGGATAKDITGPVSSGGTRESLPAGDPRNLTKVDVPVIRFQTMFEVRGASVVRQNEADYPLMRYYEGAGLTHVDTWLDLIGGQALVRDLGLPPSFCPSPVLPVNPIRNGYVQAALLDNLDDWVASLQKHKGKPKKKVSKNGSPPASRYLELTGSPVALARDADGNVIGGIRPPDIQLPLGTTRETNAGPGFCGLFGSFEPFSDAKLNELYPDHKKYVKQYKKAVKDSEKEGFLLKEDGKALIDAAEQSSIGT